MWRALDPKKRYLVADDVAKRIVSQAEALGYQPNRHAANLGLGRSDLTGVPLPDIANPAFAPILGGITETFSMEGCAPIVATVSQDDELVGFCIQRGLPVILAPR